MKINKPCFALLRADRCRDTQWPQAAPAARWLRGRRFPRHLARLSMCEIKTTCVAKHCSCKTFQYPYGCTSLRTTSLMCLDAIKSLECCLHEPVHVYTPYLSNTSLVSPASHVIIRQATRPHSMSWDDDACRDMSELFLARPPPGSKQFHGQGAPGKVHPKQTHPIKCSRSSRKRASVFKVLVKIRT